MSERITTWCDTSFAPSAGAGLPHASLGLVNYAHCSSPIRRYADLHNQHVLFRTMMSLAPAAGPQPPAAAEAAAGGHVVVDTATLDALKIPCAELPGGVEQRLVNGFDAQPGVR